MRPTSLGDASKLARLRMQSDFTRAGSTPPSSPAVMRASLAARQRRSSITSQHSQHSQHSHHSAGSSSPPPSISGGGGGSRSAGKSSSSSSSGSSSNTGTPIAPPPIVPRLNLGKLGIQGPHSLAAPVPSISPDMLSPKPVKPMKSVKAAAQLSARLSARKHQQHSSRFGAPTGPVMLSGPLTTMVSARSRRTRTLKRGASVPTALDHSSSNAMPSMPASPPRQHRSMSLGGRRGADNAAVGAGGAGGGAGAGAGAGTGDSIVTSAASSMVFSSPAAAPRGTGIVRSILGVLKRATFDAAATGSDRVSLPVGAVEKIQLQVKTLGLLVADATPVTPSRPYSPATRLTVPTPTSTEDHSGRHQSRQRRGSLVIKSPRAPPLPRDVDLEPVMQRINEWDFDIFAVANLVTSDCTLTAVGIELFRRNGFQATFCIADRTLVLFLSAIEGRYLSRNPYHNSVHGADVGHAVHYMLNSGGLTAWVDKASALGLVTAALCHDVGHLGVNNAFLVATGHELAIRYNDASPLENMHAATCFEVMRKPKHNVMAALSAAEAKSVRKTMMKAILATDNDRHKGLMSELVALTKLPGISVSTLEMHKDLVLGVVLHAADVSNPAKAWHLSRAWADRIVEEFFAQGDQERAAGIPVGLFCDREKPIPLPAFQSGFIKNLVAPLFNALAAVPGVTIQPCLDQMQANLDSWAAVAENAAGAGAK